MIHETAVNLTSLLALMTLLALNMKLVEDATMDFATVHLFVKMFDVDLMLTVWVEITFLLASASLVTSATLLTDVKSHLSIFATKMASARWTRSASSPKMESVTALMSATTFDVHLEPFALLSIIDQSVSVSLVTLA